MREHLEQRQASRLCRGCMAQSGAHFMYEHAWSQSMPLPLRPSRKTRVHPTYALHPAAHSPAAAPPQPGLLSSLQPHDRRQSPTTWQVEHTAASQHPCCTSSTLLKPAVMLLPTIWRPEASLDCNRLLETAQSAGLLTAELEAPVADLGGCVDEFEADGLQSCARGGREHRPPQGDEALLAAWHSPLHAHG